MAQRRMISLEVVDTDAFLDMPQSSQLLYFHLNARADDDGFVANPKRVMRDIGSQIDDLKVLIGKKFLISFEDGVVVIKHWRINNFIRKDIYKETKYLDHKQVLFIRPNGAYTLTNDGRAIGIPRGHFQLEDVKPKQLKGGSTKGKSGVNEVLTKREPSIGKDRLGKDSIEKDNTAEINSANVVLVIDSFQDTNPSYKKWYGNTTQRKAIKNLLETHGIEKLLKVISFLPKVAGREYFPTITTPLQLEDKWASLEIAVKRLSGKEKNYVL